MTNTFDKEVQRILQFTTDYEDSHPLALTTKLFEEGGELSEVVLKMTGHLRHKDKEFEPVMEEAADVINVTLGILAVVFPEKSPEELGEELLTALNKKANKYLNILLTVHPNDR